VSRGETAFVTVMTVLIALVILIVGRGIGKEIVVDQCRKYGAYKTGQVEMTCEVRK
jgi:hypothetical protein